LAIILDAQAVGNLVDDRPLPAPTAAILEAEKAKAGDPLTREESFAREANGEISMDLLHAIVGGTMVVFPTLERAQYVANVMNNAYSYDFEVVYGSEVGPFDTDGWGVRRTPGAGEEWEEYLAEWGIGS
jgi:hypothetical protein